MTDTPSDRWLWRAAVILIGLVSFALGIWTCMLAVGQ